MKVPAHRLGLFSWFLTILPTLKIGITVVSSPSQTMAIVKGSTRYCVTTLKHTSSLIHNRHRRLERGRPAEILWDLKAISIRFDTSKYQNKYVGMKLKDLFENKKRRLK